MGYKVEYGALDALLDSYSAAVSKWNEGISAVMGQEGVIEASTSVSGNNANRMKEYLKTAYSCANASMSMLLEMFRQNFLLYTEAYYQQVDPAGDTCIDEAELSERRTNLQGKRTQLQQIGLAAENSVRGISDLVSVTNLDISETDTKFSKILDSLDELDDSVNGLESAHSSADFTNIDALLTQLDTYLQELIGLSKEYKTAFSMESFLALASVPSLLLATNDAYDQLTAQESDVARAANNLEKRLKLKQEELKKRQEQAEWAKIGVNVFVGFVSAAVLVTAGPVGAIVVGAISGAASASFSAAADEYAEKGWNRQDWNMDRIKIHGCIGAVTGMVGGMIAPGTGACAKAGIKAMSSAFEGVASTSYDQLAAYGRITDTKEIVGDAILKGTSTFVGSWIGSTVSDHVSDFVKQNDTIKDLAEHVVGGQHFGAVLQVEGASGLVSGVVKRFSSTAVKETGGFVASIAEGKTIAEAYDEHSIISESFQDAVDMKSVVNDAASAVTTAATDNPLYASEKKLEYYRSDDYYLFGDSPDLNGKKGGWKEWDSEEYDRMMQKLAEMDERGADARNYEIFGDPRTFSYQRQSAINAAWEQERQLVMQGRGTRDWTVSQQEELLRTGRVSGFDGSHMLDASSNPSVANNPDNIQFLTYEEHIYGAHGDNTHNPTTGWFDTSTGETITINAGQIPHREKMAFELTDKFDYQQMDLAEELGASFGYDRGSKST